MIAPNRPEQYASADGQNLFALMNQDCVTHHKEADDEKDWHSKPN